MFGRIACVLLAVGATACQSRTELMVGVITELRAPDVINDVKITVLRDGVPVMLPGMSDWPITGGKMSTFILPGSYGLYSPDGSTPKVEVVLTGLKDGKTIVERKALVSLVAQKTLFMRMGMVVGCMSKLDCLAGTTCIEGSCKDELVDERTLPEFKPELVDHITCQSGENFINTTDNSPVPPLGDMTCAGTCVEGTCYNPPPTDGGVKQLPWVAQVTPASASRSAVLGIWGTTSNGYDVFAVGENNLILHLNSPGATSGSGPAPTHASGWFDESPSPNGPTLRSISGSGFNDIWAVGDAGTILHHTAGGWGTALAAGMSPASVSFTSVWANSPNDAWAAGVDGSNDTVAIFRFTGTQWARDNTLPNTPAMKGKWSVASNGPNRAELVGTQGQTLFFIAPTWTPQSLGSQDLLGLWWDLQGTPFTVGAGGSIFVTNVTEPSPTMQNLNAVFVLSRSATDFDAYSVGDQGTILHAASMAFQPEPSGASAPLFAVWGASPSDVYAVGAGGTVLHSSGTGTHVGNPNDAGITPMRDGGSSGGPDMGLGCGPGVPAFLADAPNAGGTATDGQFVYWTDPGTQSLRKVSVCGGSPITLNTNPPVNNPGDIAVDSNGLYFINGGDLSIYKTTVNGGALTLLSTDTTAPQRLVLDGQHNVYFSDASAIKKVGPSTSNLTVTLNNVAVSPLGPLGFGSNRVLWPDNSGQIEVLLPNGSNAPVSVGTFQICRGVATSPIAPGVFWTDEGAGSINQFLAPNIVKPLATNLTAPAAVATDGQSIYFGTFTVSNVSNDSISRLAISGGMPTPIVTNLTGPTNLLVDGQSIYYINNGALRKAPK